MSKIKLYANGSDTLGTFTTRSPQRPYSIALPYVHVTYIDVEHGIIGPAYMNANDQSSVLDIEPCTSSLDPAGVPEVPVLLTLVEQSGNQR